MSTRKIRDLAPDETCRHAEHNPPSHMHFTDGVWEHTCPACKNTIVWTVRSPRYISAFGGVK